ncbi:MAG: hydroxymethylbilane synthase [Pelagibacteraceae bacterium]|nr:hydroxymethylbilane synthase [Pelagibacteraceae bacterium]
MIKNKIIIGSRGSKLAILYAEKAKETILDNNVDLNKDSIDIKIIKTTADIHHSESLSEIGGKGLFSKQIEEELLNKQIDIAIHALKDLPSEETRGLETKIFLKRNDPRDVFISLKYKSIIDLKPNSIIGTSSFRRAAQLNVLRKDLNINLIRGNIDTRINKLEKENFDAIVLSYAGIKTLGLEKKVSQIFSIEEMLPCVGQGVIVLQTRKNDQNILNLIHKINDPNTLSCVIAERTMLKTIKGDCNTAVGGLATINSNLITLRSELFSTDGKQKFSYKISGKVDGAKEIGVKVGTELIAQAGNTYKNK